MTMRKIDGHMHIPQWLRFDDKTAFQVIDDYCRDYHIAYVDNMCCTNNADLWDGYEMDQSILGAIAKLESPHVFTHGCLWIPKNGPVCNFVDQLEELMEMGLDGIKICDFKPDAYKLLNVAAHLDEYEDYISACEKYGVHMCWHVADPDFFWDGDKVSQEIKSLGWFYGNGTYPAYDALMDYAYGLLDRHPKLHVQLAHAFFHSEEPDKLEALLQKHPNVQIDLAPGGEMFNGYRHHYDKWYRIFRTYSDRFVYATDTSTTYDDSGLEYLAESVWRFLATDDRFDYSDSVQIHGIALDGEQLENILYNNHARAVGDKPKPIHKPALKRYIDRHLPDMPDSQNKRKIEAYYRKELL